MEAVDFAMTVNQPMPDAQSEIISKIEPRMRSIGYAGHSNGDAVRYRPKFVGLVIIWVYRRIIQNEQVTFSFKSSGPATEVRVSGKLRPRAVAEVTEAVGNY
jgi:hypothetical protein